MGNIFRKLFGLENKVTEQDRAIWDLKVQRDKLKQYQKKIMNVMEKETEIARKLIKEGKRDRAALALRKKKYQETLLQKTDAQLQNLHEMLETIEFAKIEKEVLDGLKQGTKALKSLQEEMKIEDIEKIMEETREAIEYQNEISRLLSESLTQEDEDSVKNELEQLESSLLGEKLDAVKVPEKKVETQEVKEAKKEEKVEKEEIQVEEEEEEEEVEKEKVAIPA